MIFEVQVITRPLLTSRVSTCFGLVKGGIYKGPLGKNFDR